MSLFHENPKRPGAGAMPGKKATGGNAGGVRVGNTPAVVVDIDAPPQRHTTNGKVEKTSEERFDTRENGKTPNGK